MMISRNGIFSVQNRPGDIIRLLCPLPGSFVGLIVATSKWNAGLPAESSSKAALARGASTNPNPIGIKIAALHIPASRTTAPRDSRRTGLPHMIRRTRSFRSDPVMPETQASGDSIENSHARRMLDAYTSGSLPIRITSSSQASSRASIARATSTTKPADGTRRSPRRAWQVPQRDCPGAAHAQVRAQ